MNDTNTSVVDGDIVDDVLEQPSDTPVDTTSQSDMPSDVTVLMNLESMIKSHITGLDDRRTKLKNLKEMMTSAFKNDSAYQDGEAAVKEATKLKKDAKARLMKLPEVKNVVEKVNELATEVKDMDGALSDYLREYQRLSGSNEIVDDNGQIHEITYVAKLIKKAK